MTTELSTQKNNEMALQLNNIVDSVITQVHLKGFERAYATATAIGKLKEILTEEYLTPIMALQGNRLGVKTDKDKSGGYPMDIFKNCLIEAVLMGLQPYGNEFNIIAGNTYATKEGLGRLLATWKGLQYTLICGVPKPQQDGKSAVVDVEIKWTINGNSNTQVIPISVKLDQWTSVDALIGKATRKGRAWLVSAISGIEITDGEIEDIKYTEVSSKPNPTTVSDEKEKERVKKHIDNSKDIVTLERCAKAIKEDMIEVKTLYCYKHIEISNSIEELKSCKFSSYISPDEDYDLFIAFEDKEKEISKK